MPKYAGIGLASRYALFIFSEGRVGDCMMFVNILNPHTRGILSHIHRSVYQNGQEFV